MSLKDGIISAPVSIDDVKSVLGESSNDLATLCKSGNVNAFSKHKPVPYNKLFTDENEYVQGKDYNYGLSKPFKYAVAQLYTKGSTVGDSIFDEDRPLTYTHPAGGASDPFRIGDFRNYTNKMDWSNSGLSNMLFRINSFGVTNGKAYINDEVGIGLQIASESQDRLLNFYEVMTDANLSIYPSLLFRLPAVTSGETNYISKGGYVYKIISAPYTLAQIKGGSVKYSTPYKIEFTVNGTTYNLGTFVAGTKYYFSISINLSEQVFSLYKEKKISILPCFTWDRFYFKLRTENSAAQMFALPNVVVNGAGTNCLDDVDFTFTLGNAGSSPTADVPPKIAIQAISPHTFTFDSNGSITINSIKFKFTNQSEGNISRSIQITSVQVAIYGKNSSGAIAGISSQSPTTVISSADKMMLTMNSFVYGGITYWDLVNSSSKPLTAKRYTTSGFSSYAVGIFISIMDNTSGKTNSATFYYGIG